MDHSRPDQHALNVATAVQEAVSPATVILFGSRAHGRHNPSSDIDLLVIAPGPTTAGPDITARRTAHRYMKANPPQLNTDVITLTRKQFNRFRLANQHVAGQAANHGVVMSGEKLDYTTEPQDEYPAHWPETKQRLENTEESQFHFNTMVEGNTGNQKLMGFVAQQALENALKGWLSTYNDSRTFGHELTPLWEDLRALEDWDTPQLHRLQQQVDALFEYTRYEDPDNPGNYLDWLTNYSVTYRYGRPSHTMNREERKDLQYLLNAALDGITARIHQRSRTSPNHLWTDGTKPWE